MTINMDILWKFEKLCLSLWHQMIMLMRHRIKAGKVGSFTPEKQQVEEVQLEDREIIEDVENIFEEDTAFSNDDEALAAMEFYDSPEDME